MATRNIVPRADGEGSIGTLLKKWGAVYADDILSIGGVKLYDTDASNTLQLKWNEDDVANRILNILVNAADRSIDLGGNLTLEAAAILDQDYTSDAEVIFAGVKASGVALLLQDDAAQDIKCFGSAGVGENPYFYIYGDKAGVPKYIRNYIDPTGFGRIESEDGMTIFGAGDKGGFFGLATPIVRPAAIADATGPGDVVYRLNDVIQVLRDLNLIAT